jgi:hypothetical protein
MKKQKRTAEFQLGLSKTGGKGQSWAFSPLSQAKTALHLPFRSDTYAPGGGVNPAGSPQ